MQLMAEKPKVPVPGIPTGGSKRGLQTERRVVIVEDQLMIAWSLEATVEDLGYSVVGIFADGQAALNNLVKQPADLVLMDINLGRGIDGVEIARLIKAAHGIPVIFISAYADPKTEARIAALVSGSPLLSKPIQTAALDAAITAAFNRRH